MQMVEVEAVEAEVEAVEAEVEAVEEAEVEEGGGGGRRWRRRSTVPSGGDHCGEEGVPRYRVRTTRKRHGAQTAYVQWSPGAGGPAPPVRRRPGTRGPHVQRGGAGTYVSA